MKIYTNWAFLRPVNTSLHGDFTIENPSFSMSLLSTQEHTIPLCVKILQILFRLELSWFWIEGNGRFWDFLLFMYHCVVKSSVCTVATQLKATLLTFFQNGSLKKTLNFSFITYLIDLICALNSAHLVWLLSAQLLILLQQDFLWTLVNI